MAHSTTFYLWVPASVVETLGVLLTAWRIYFRIRIHRFWWEDAWAATLLITSIISIVAFWVYLLADVSASIVASWIYTICFTCIVTLARMSILFSIIRVIHGSPRLRGFTYACVAFFAACWVILIVEKAWQCASDPGWQQVVPLSTKYFCVVEPQISIFEFTTDCITISILVVLPLRMLWKVKLPRRQRRMILSIFASSVVLAFGAIFHTVGQILKNNTIAEAGLHVEVCLSIVVCNLLVVVTYTYQFLLHDSQSTGTTDDTSDDDFTTVPRPQVPVTRTTLTLTTVDLEVALSSTGHQSSIKPESSTLGHGDDL